MKKPFCGHRSCGSIIRQTETLTYVSVSRISESEPATGGWPGDDPSRFELDGRSSSPLMLDRITKFNEASAFHQLRNQEESGHVMGNDCTRGERSRGAAG